MSRRYGESAHWRSGVASGREPARSRTQQRVRNAPMPQLT
jgi:hypothetical protein